MFANLYHRISPHARERVWLPIGRIIWTFHRVPLVVAAIVAWLFWRVGQMHQIYMSQLETGDVAHFILAAGALTLLSAALFLVNYKLATSQIDLIYEASPDLRFDRRLKSIFRYPMSMFCALLPWAGLALGLHKTADDLRSHGASLTKAAAGYDPIVVSNVADAVGGMNALATQADRVIWGIPLGAAVVFAVLHLWGRKTWFSNAFLLLTIALLAASALLPALPLDGASAADVALYQFMGPFATVAFSALFVFAILSALALLSQERGFPLITAIIIGVVAMFVFSVPLPLFTAVGGALLVVLGLTAAAAGQFAMTGLAAVLAFFAFAATHRLNEAASQPPLTASQKTSAPLLKPQFDRWLGTRADRGKYGEKAYPVFIIAAQGGGIYAAVSAAAFLARLQDRCPNFAQHVFAISGVSGGAVGAALFQSALGNAAPTDETCELGKTRAPALQKQMSSVLLGDHLSPLLGMILPELMGFHIDDRGRALERSLVASVSSPRDNLLGAFSGHWSAERAPPALVLNTTWVETGYRVAFAPFGLKGSGDGTLWSFADFITDSKFDPKVIEAAAVSARFPGVTPAYAVSAALPLPSDAARFWNFVDGGYADNSGAATAQVIYESLRPEADAANVDLRLILLADAYPEVNLGDIRGALTRDSTAPFETVLNVRGLLARQAVTRATPPRNENVKQFDEKVRVVKLDLHNFSLPLAWKISKSTYGLISLLMGRREFCRRLDEDAWPSGGEDDAKAKDISENITRETLSANGCVVKDIETLLSAK